MSLTSKVGVCWLIVPGPGWGGPAGIFGPYVSQPPLGPQRGSPGHVVLPGLE